jgi:microcystin-dependent protein
MPRNSAGTYAQPASDVNPPIAGTVIDPVAYAAAITDIGTELTNSVDRLGRGAMQASLAMGGNNITNAGAPIGLNDVVRLTDLSSYLPPAIILPYFGIVAPTGWLICDGTAYSRSTYAALFAVIGTTAGAGNGSTTFNVPDLRGSFVRGLDSGKGLDPSRVFATYQADMFAAHTHLQNAHAHTDSGHGHTYLASAGASIAGTGSNFVETSTSIQNTGSGFASILPNTATNQNAGSLETAPKNWAMPFIIRT